MAGPPVERADLHGLATKRAHRAGPVVDELGRSHREDDARPLPRVRSSNEGAPARWATGCPARARAGHREDLELSHRGRALPVDRPEAVGPGVAAPDDRDALGAGADPRHLQRALTDEVRRFQVLHGEVHAPQVTPGHGEVTRARGAARQHDGVEFASKGLG